MNKKAVFIIIIVGTAVFFNVLFNGFVWDDKNYITGNPAINANFFTRENTFNTVGQYRPVIAAYFSFTHRLFGNTAFFYHLIQIALHVTNSALLFLFFSNFFSKKLALFSSLIFLTHSIQVESASFIAATAEPLVFFIGILILHKFRENVPRRGLFFALFLTALLVKETGILLVLLVFLCYLIFRRDHLKSVILAGATSIGAYFLVRFFMGQVYFERALLTPIARLDLSERIINIPAAFFYYLKTFFFPRKLAIDQLWTISTTSFQDFYWPFLVSILFFVTLGIIGVYIFMKNKKTFPVFVFFLLWFLISASMFLQIHPLDETVADRWFYFPIVGLIGIFAVAADSLRISGKTRKAGLILGTILIVVLSVRTVIRNTNWSNAVMLYTHDMKISNNFSLENHLAAEYLASKEYDKAEEHFLKSISLFPYEGNIYNLALLYEKIGKIENAKEYYYRALAAKKYISNKPNLVTYIGLARVLVLYDNPESARDLAQKALQDYPESADLWIALAVGEHRLQNRDKALVAASKARELRPNSQTEYLYNQILNNLPINVEP